MFAVLHIADFALEAVLRTEPGDPASLLPAPAPRPAALFSGTGKKSLVLVCNAPARAAGVAPGMTAPQAVARCPALLIRPPRPAAEAEARAALLAVGFTLAPALEDTAPGVCTIDLRGSDPARQQASALAALAQLAALALPASAGLARTPLLALYAARQALPCAPGAPAPVPDDPMVGEAPAGEPGLFPSGAALSPSLIVVAEEKSFLAPLPLATADPPPGLAAIFATWGLRTLGDFTALPRDEIVRRFGAEGLAFWQRANGGEPRPLRPVVPAREFAAALDFEEPVETLEPLLFILRRLLDRFALELLGAQLVAAELDLGLQLADGPPHTRTFRLPEPTADATILFRTLHTHLESLHTASPITGLRLRAAPARPLVRQQDLFASGLRDPHGFAETLARVSALVGAERLGTPQPEETHRPDAVKLTPPPAVIPPPAPRPVHPLHGLPLRRFRPPLPARLEFAPAERQPVYVWTERFHDAITHVRGPWCSSGDWWQADRAWSRLEWDIALAGGGLYRLLRLGEAWFIEGEYD
jgi:protein ImuB